MQDPSCSSCASSRRLHRCFGDPAEKLGAAVAARLGFDGCKLSKPLTIAEVMAKDMSGGNGASRAHPDWDELIARRQSGDQVYFVDCRRVDLSNILAGTSLYILVRAGAVIARVAETGIN